MSEEVKEMFKLNELSSSGRLKIRNQSQTSVEQVNLMKPHDNFQAQESLINYLAGPSQSTSTVRFTFSSSDSDSDESKTGEHQPRTSSKYFVELLETAGSWHLYRFESIPWAELPIERKILRLKATMKSQEDKEQTGVLTDKMMAAVLQYLEKCPEISKYAYSKCVLHNLKLIDLTAIRKYNFLQYLDVSRNRLTSLEALENLPFLQYLDASSNFLTSLLDFKPPFYLGYVDYSNNLVEKIPDLSGFWSLLTLNLASNNIEKFEGLRNLKYLSYLVLDNNRITKLDNIDNSWIKVLHVSKNSITEIEGDPFGFGNIVDVDISSNDLTSLSYFDQFTMLQTLDVSYNNISNLLDIYYLQNKRYLKSVDLRGNPISFGKNFTETCLAVLKQIGELNGEILTSERKASFKNASEIDHLDVRMQKLKLMVLEHLNVPKIANYLVPYDVPPPNVVVFVGVPASGKAEKVIKCIKKLHQSIVVGVVYTDRPKRSIEVHGQSYHFVDKGKFSEMTANGEFLTVSEFDGYCYGITFTELEKGIDKMLVFQSDVRTGLSLRLSGLRPKLILTIPRDEGEHIAWLKMNCKYSLVAENAIRITYADVVTTTPSNSTRRPKDQEDVHYFEKRRRFSKMSSLKYRGSDGGYKFEEEDDEDYDDYDDDVEDFTPGKMGADGASKERQAETVQAEPEALYPQESDVRIDEEGPEHLGRFLEMILKERKELLQLHWDNPGFFRDVVFTDDSEEELTRKLRDLLKSAQENYEKCKVTNYCLEGDESLEGMVNDKLSFMKLEDNLFNGGGY